MTSANLFRAALLGLVAFGGCGGCGGLVRSLHKTMPSLEGRWTGRVVPVELRDDEGRPHTVAALQIASGPEWRQEIPPKLGGGSSPLLLKTVDNQIMVMAPQELPEGRLVEVYGTMYVTTAYLPPGSSQGRVVSRMVSRDPDGTTRLGGEHMIVVREHPTPLAD